MHLLREVRGQILLLTIDGEAQYNVLSRELVGELKAEAERVSGAPTLRAVVLTGKGPKAFCAGANLKERTAWSVDDVRRWLVELQAALRAIELCQKPWIAAINGFALGGGCELSLACDLRVADPAAQLGLPEVKLGVIPGGGGTVRLARLVGLGRARELILTARRVDSVEALAMGLVNRVSAPGRSVEAALALAEQLAQHAPVAVSAAKASLLDAWDLDLDAALDRERAHYEQPLQSQDRLEGLEAFAQKRPPDWKGR